MILPKIICIGVPRRRECHIHRRPRRVRGQRAVPVRSAARRADPPRYPQGHPRVGHLQAGGAGVALVVRRHPDDAAGPGQRHRRLDRLRLPRRGHHGARRAQAVAARGAAGRQGRRAHPRDPRRQPDLHRPELHPGPHPRAWTCGGRASTTTTAGTSRSSPPPTAGRCGPRRCAPAASTTPPPPAPTPTCSTRSPPGSTTASSAWPTWATKARPTSCASRSRNPPTAS